MIKKYLKYYLDLPVVWQNDKLRKLTCEDITYWYEKDIELHLIPLEEVSDEQWDEISVLVSENDGDAIAKVMDIAKVVDVLIDSRVDVFRIINKGLAKQLNSTTNDNMQR